MARSPVAAWSAPIRASSTRSSSPSGQSVRQVPCGCCGGGLGPTSFGLKAVSIAQPSPANSAALTRHQGRAAVQLAPGISAVVIAIEKVSGDQQSVATKPRWIASSMRLSRIVRTSSLGSRAVLEPASVPRSWMAP